MQCNPLTLDDYVKRWKSHPEADALYRDGHLEHVDFVGARDPDKLMELLIKASLVGVSPTLYLCSRNGVTVIAYYEKYEPAHTLEGLLPVVNRMLRRMHIARNVKQEDVVICRKSVKLINWNLDQCHFFNHDKIPELLATFIPQIADQTPEHNDQLCIGLQVDLYEAKNVEEIKQRLLTKYSNAGSNKYTSNRKDYVHVMMQQYTDRLAEYQNFLRASKLNIALPVYFVKEFDSTQWVISEAYDMTMDDYLKANSPTKNMQARMLYLVETLLNVMHCVYFNLDHLVVKLDAQGDITNLALLNWDSTKYVGFGETCGLCFSMVMVNFTWGGIFKEELKKFDDVTWKIAKQFFCSDQYSKCAEHFRSVKRKEELSCGDLFEAMKKDALS